MTGSSDDEDRLHAQLAAARAEVKHLRKLRSAVRDDKRRASEVGAELAAAIDREERARISLRIFETHGSEHGLWAEADRVRGTVAIEIPPGSTKRDRLEAIERELGPQLLDAARSLGALPVASVERFTVERKGRDSFGRTVLDVEGRVEGDQLVPAIKLIRRG